MDIQKLLEVGQNDKNIHKFLVESECISIHVSCKRCICVETFERKIIPVKVVNNKLVAKCSKCKIKHSAFEKSIFFNCKIGAKILLYLVYSWSLNFSVRQAQLIFKITRKMTILSWYAKFNEMCTKINIYMLPRKIGGVGCIVEIDESKFSKRKYNVGRLIRSVWVVGGVCRETKQSFFVEVTSRSAAVLTRVVIDNVVRGTIIYTDCWRGYNYISNHGYVHYTVNHSRNFVNPVNYVNTQMIESNWGALKRFMRRRNVTNRSNILNIFNEYIYKKNNESDTFICFLKHSYTYLSNN